jgi:hypothetical protein
MVCCDVQFLTCWNVLEAVKTLGYDQGISNILTTVAPWCMVRLLVLYVISTNFGRFRLGIPGIYICSLFSLFKTTLQFLSSREIEHGEWCPRVFLAWIQCLLVVPSLSGAVDCLVASPWTKSLFSSRGSIVETHLL